MLWPRIGLLSNNMKKIGIALVVVSLTLGFISDYLPIGFPIEPVVGLAFGYFLLGIYVLIKSK
jgi:uncharacterized protein involved in cysteine biosynthesis